MDIFTVTATDVVNMSYPSLVIHLEALCNEQLDGNSFKSAAVTSYNLAMGSAITMS